MSVSRPALPLLMSAALALAACGGDQQRPYHFTASRGTDIDNSFERVARALADLGHTPVTVERGSGLITTKWEDTGMSFGLVEGKTATLVKRFHLTVQKGASGDEVTVKIELKKCAEGFTIKEDTDLVGTCEAMGDLPDPQQREVDQLGQGLEQTLSKGQ